MRNFIDIVALNEAMNDWRDDPEGEYGRSPRHTYAEEDPLDREELRKRTGSRLASQFRYLNDNDVGFRVLDHEDEKHAPERPLAVVIHPGDMIIHGFGYADTAPEDRELLRQAMAWSRANIAGMKKELSVLRRKGYDFVVLHRESSVQWPDELHRDDRKAMWAEFQANHKRGTMLFGDSLDKAGQWMVNNLHIADRPHVYMLGAYSDPKHGCLTHIGKQFAKVLSPEKITVSEFSPVSDDPEEQHTAWRP